MHVKIIVIVIFLVGRIIVKIFYNHNNYYIPGKKVVLCLSLSTYNGLNLKYVVSFVGSYLWVFEVSIATKGKFD